MRLRQIILMTISLFFSTFASGDEQSAMGTLQNLWTAGERSMTARDYPKALKAYKLILENPDLAFLLDEQAKGDIYIKVAQAWLELKKPDQAAKALAALKTNILPEHLVLKSEILKGRVLKEKGEIIPAYEGLKELSKQIKTYEWNPDDRALLIGLKDQVNQIYEERIFRADRAFDGGSLDEARTEFDEIFKAGLTGGYPAVGEDPNRELLIKLGFRLAQVEFQLNHYTEVIGTIDQIEPYLNGSFLSLSRGCYYLKGLALRRIGSYSQAVEQFQRYLALGDRSSLKYYDQVLYEIGYSFYMQSQFQKSRRTFEAITKDSIDPKLYLLSEIYLARIDLSEQKWKRVESRLTPLAADLDRTNSLHFEIAYLRGEALFHLGEYAYAKEQYERAVPVRNEWKAPWAADTYYNLGWSYLKLADDADKPPVKQEAFFAQAEESFKKMLTLSVEDRGFLGLARVYLTRGKRLGDGKYLAQIESLLGTPGTLTTLDGEGEALLMRAEAMGSFETKEELYSLLTAERFSSTAAYRIGWQSRGLNLLHEGKRLAASAEGEKANDRLNRAIECFGKSFLLQLDHSPAIAGLAAKFQAESYLQIGTDQALETGFLIADKLIRDHHQIFLSMKQPDEVLYLRAFIASKMGHRPEGEQLAKVAQESLEQIIANYSKGEFADHALNLLGALQFRQGKYEEAQQTYLKLAADYAHSPLAGDAWFWAGESADWLHLDPQLIKEYRKNVFEHYGNSPHAAEAYFEFYSFTDYLRGDSGAVNHLLEMKNRYPQSQYLVIAEYLSGLYYQKNGPAKDLQQAMECFQRAQTAFDFAWSNRLIKLSDAEYFITFYYRSKLELAETDLLIAAESEGAKKQIYYEYAEENYKKILQDFDWINHPLASVLTKGENYPRILEESHFGLASVYIKKRELDQAEEIFKLMEGIYTKSGIIRGYTLSRLWYERGMIQVGKSEYEIALKSFNRSEESATERVLSEEELLGLWIEQSHCLAKMERDEEAMLLLSKVINSTAASPLRIKAMYLRAELYEQMGKPELAYKQLEAATRKGGEWAMKAKEKMEKEYEYR